MLHQSRPRINSGRSENSDPNMTLLLSKLIKQASICLNFTEFLNTNVKNDFQQLVNKKTRILNLLNLS